MSNEEKNIDRIFRDRLRNFDADPPAEVWNNISEKFNLDRRRKVILWVMRVAAGIAILTVLSLTYYIIRKPATHKLITGDKRKVEQQVSKPENDSSAVKSSVGEKKAVRKLENSEEFLPSGETALNKGGERYAPGLRGLPKNKQNSEPDGTIAVLSDQEKLNYITSKSLKQVDFYLLMPAAGLLTKQNPDATTRKGSVGEENPEEDLYALNIPEENEKQEGRWAVGTEISPLYSYRSLETQNETMSFASDLNRSESGVLAYSGGVNVNYSPVKRLSLQSGVYYSKYGVNVDNAYVFEDATGTSASINKYYSINTSSGIIDIEKNPSFDYVTNKGDRKNYNNGSASTDQYAMEVNSGEVTQNFEYIEVPLILRYKIIDRKIGFILLGGLSTNLLVGSNTYFHTDSYREKIGETTDIKPFNYSSIVGLGLDYFISKHLNLSFEPTFRYYLNSINKSSVIRSYPYSIGIFTGLRYNF